MHKIDLEKYEIRTDMAIDLTEKDKKTYKPQTYNKNGVKVSWIKLEENNDIGKKPGNYLTLEFDDVTDDDAKKNVSKVFKEELYNMLLKSGFNKKTKTLVIGLGNPKSTPDALGPLVSEKILVTKHFFYMGLSVEDKFSCVSAFYPGVTGTTGIETSDLISGVKNISNPDLIIVIDALASSSISRVNKSIQVSDAGISPGSGIGNKRKEISKETLKTPVIAIGVPTVVDATTVVLDTIDFMMKHFSYNLNNKNSIDKLIPNSMNNYLRVQNIPLKNEEREFFLGAFGMLSNFEKKALIYDVLTPIGYNLMVTPKEIDFDILNLSKLIGESINEVIHDIK